MSLRGKTLFITGASRCIGKAIALRAAADGANIAVAAKTTEPHPRLPGTIHTAVAEINAAGGKGLAVKTDIRFEEQVKAAMEATVEAFGGIDILINNASAISLTPTLATPMKRFDLMHQVNARGTFLVTQAALPYLKKGNNPHVLMLSPPLNMDKRWFAPHCAYTMAKYGMSMCVLGMAEEFRGKVGFNALWPRTAIDTAAVRNLLGGDEAGKRSRTPEILADAAYAILNRPHADCTGNFFIDDEVMTAEGVTDLSKYLVDAAFADELVPDFFL